MLDGTKRHVPFAPAADGFVVLARSDAGVDLFLVDPTSDGVTLDQQLTIASDTQYEVTFDGVRVSAGSRIGAAGTGWDDLGRHDARRHRPARRAGGRRRALRARDHRAVREGPRSSSTSRSAPSRRSRTTWPTRRPRSTAATILVYEAAWARANGRPIDRLAPMAKLFACQTFRDVTAMGQQVFGGVGFTLEYDIQLYFRRAKQLQISWWDDRYLEELIAAQTLD